MQSVVDLIERIITALTETVSHPGKAGQVDEHPREATKPNETTGQGDQAEPATASRLWTELLLQSRPEPNPISIQRQARMIANTIARPAIPLPP